MYQVISHCIRGARHTYANRPCQDRFQIRQEGRQTLLAVCDGHGGRPYTRSGLGARILSKAAADLLIGSGSPPDAELAAMLKDAFDAKVRRHLDFHPLASWEIKRLEGRPAEYAYGTTLVCALLTPEETMCVQLGDGGIFVMDKDGAFLPPMPEDAGCIGNITSSMVYPRERCMEHFRIRHYPPAAAVFVFSDGYAFQFDYPYDLASVLSEGVGTLEQRLDAVLHTGAHGDDLTLVMAFAPDAVKTPQFLSGLSRTLQRGKQCNDLHRLNQRIKELECYLRLAKVKATRMKVRHDPEYASYSEVIRPRADEFSQLLEERKMIQEAISE